MDPNIQLIVTAAALGAAAGVKPVVEQAVKDAYAGLKSIIKKYSDASLDALEKKPESQAKKDSLAEDLADAGAGQDEELLKQARKLYDAITPEAAQVIGVDLEDIKAKSLEIEKIISTGTGFKARRAEFTGDIKLGEVIAGTPENKPEKKE